MTRRGTRRPRRTSGTGAPAASASSRRTERAAAATPAPDGAAVPRRLRFFDDLKPDEPSIHLPLIQCRECHVTGWGTVKRPTEPRLDGDLRVFYNRFFLRDVDVAYLFPAAAPPGVRGLDVTVCGACGAVQAADATACARAASLLSVALGQAQGSRYNDDRKVIAFSDNVQDAAHRAGFFAARTTATSLRAAIAQVVERHDGIALAELPERALVYVAATRAKRELLVLSFDKPIRLL